MFGIESIDPSLMIAAVGVGIAATQVTLGLRRDRFENTFRLIQWLQDPEMLVIRNSTAQLIAKAKDFDFDFYRLSSEERARLSAVANLFGFSGLLAKKNQINREVLLSGWSRHIIATYDRLGPYFQWRQTLAGGDSLRPYFEWLVKRAALHNQRREPTIAKKPANLATQQMRSAMMDTDLT